MAGRYMCAAGGAPPGRVAWTVVALLAALALLVLSLGACTPGSPVPGSLPAPVTVRTGAPSPHSTTLPTPSLQPTALPIFPVHPLPTEPTVSASRTFAPLTPVPTPPGAPGVDLVLLYVHDGDLWRADVSGEHRQRLTVGQPLHQRDRGRGEGCDWDRFSWGCPTRVSPDGRRIAQWVGAPGLLLVDVIEGVQGWLPGPVGPEAAWSPDGRTLAWSPDPEAPGSPAGVAEIYAYDTERGRVERLFQGDREAWGGLSHLVWSPDGRRLAFGGCYREVFVDGKYQGRTLGEVHVLDVASGDVRDTGQQIERYVARDTSLCWTGAGRITTAREEGVACSPVKMPGEAWRSPDGALYAAPAPADPQDKAGQGPSRLTVGRLATREIVWERALDVTISDLRWSPDGAYLLLGDGVPDAPIWRLPSDGTGEPEVVIEEGFLVDVVPQWAAD